MAAITPAITVVWKFPVVVQRHIMIDMPSGATILSVGMQEGHLCFWAQVNPKAPLTTRRFLCVGTGDVMSADTPPFIGTVFDRQFVWHIFGEK